MQLHPYTLSTCGRPDQTLDEQKTEINHEQRAHNKSTTISSVRVRVYYYYSSTAVVPTTCYMVPAHGKSSHPCATRRLGAVGRSPWLAVYHDCGVPGISKQRAEKIYAKLDSEIEYCSVDATRSMRSDEMSCVMETETMTSEYVPTVEGVVRRQRDGI